MIHDPVRPADPEQLPLFDEEALDIADYLRAESDAEADIHQSEHERQGMAALVIGAIGVVYGDIGTSPLYAFREALHATAAEGAQPGRAEVLGLLSLLVWTLVLIVTVKYIFALLRVDNRGEGGVLALYTLVRLALGRRSLPILALAIMAAALFGGDAVITPAISVLSAVEGMEMVLPALNQWVLPVAIGILLALFIVQRRGTTKIARFFGPITVVWFLTLGGLGLWHMAANPGILAALNPAWGLGFLIAHKGVAFVVLGAVFLAVTGGEALYADLGHFGRRPIVIAWFSLIFPALVLNYLGQGALVLADPTALENPFFSMASGHALPALVLLATAATVIAAQAVISGAFSMARAAIQLGFLPRLTMRHTAESASGQIYIGAVNWTLLFGVLWLVLSFRSSTALASAYGISVTGSMVLETTLGALFLWRVKKLPLVISLLLIAPVIMVELAFFASNAAKIADGGYVPVMIAAVLCLVMVAWWRGTQRVSARLHKLAIPLNSFVRSMRNSSVQIIPGTAFFLTPDADMVPSALLHNLKHNRVLHDQTVLLTVETLRVPYATLDERAEYEVLAEHFARLTLRFGFMETPNVSRAMVHARRSGLKFDVMASTFFLGRRRPVPSGPGGFGRMLDQLYATLARVSADPTDFFHLPRDRVVELGERVAI